MMEVHSRAIGSVAAFSVEHTRLRIAVGMIDALASLPRFAGAYAFGYLRTEPDLSPLDPRYCSSARLQPRLSS
jgi:hypothetical protein